MSTATDHTSDTTLQDSVQFLGGGGGGLGGGLGGGRVMIAAQLTFIELLLCARNYSEHI